MTTLHMKTEEVRHVAHRLDLAVGDLYFKPGTFKSAAGSIRSAWQGGRSAYYASQLQQMGNLLRDEILDLQRLVKRVYSEVSEWEEADQPDSASFDWFNKIFTVGKESLGVASALYLATHLHSSILRPNSIVFTGPNWMRKAVGIKEMTRVIKPTTLAKGMAIAGVVESAWEAGEVIMEDLNSMHSGNRTQMISTATVDGGFRFALSAVGAVGIPMALGAVVTAVGLPVVAGGAVVLAGSIVLGLTYYKWIEAQVWESWKQSAAREEIINEVANQVRNLKAQATRRVMGAFQGFIEGINAAPSPFAI